MRTELAEKQKDAAVRSISRGARARKELLAFEEQVKEARMRIDSVDASIDPDELQHEVTQASQLIATLQAELAGVRF